MARCQPRERKHKRRDTNGRDSNADEILPSTQARAEKRAELNTQRPISSQKRKRLDKYIETKLKKEENLELLKKLAAQKVDTSLFQSAKKLGRVTETKRERISRALDEKKAGVDTDGQQDAILFEERHVPAATETVSVEPVKDTALVSFGSGLKRPLDTDDSGRPVIKKRKKRGKAKIDILEEIPHASSSDSNSEDESAGSDDWNGFSDEDDTTSVESDHSQHSSLNSRASSISDEDEDIDKSDAKPRMSAFKDWADSQRNQSLGFTPSTAPTIDATVKSAFKPRKSSPDPEAASTLPSKLAYRPTQAITVTRPEDVQAARLDLPVVRDEQKIIEAVHNHPVVVVCGATGSGKTTQVPQMLLENGYASKGMIGITQPRRVATTSVATRVAHELGGDFGKRVGHQVRYDSNVRQNTLIKFMTDGILLRELSQDFVLSKYSVIVIDEAHERSINTDILIGMLSRIVPLRTQLSKEQPDKYHPLKLVVMSATLRVTDFVMNDRLFKDEKPPIVEAEGRQYPVTDHFSRRTRRDYVDEMVRKVSRGHRKLPPGGMLVFLTGQDEIQTVSQRLKGSFAAETTGFQNSRGRASLGSNAKSDFLENADDSDDSEIEISGLDGSDDDGDDGEFQVEEDAEKPRRGPLKAHIVPLYAALPSHEQTKVFKPPPDGYRMIVLATNVAETSLTIPDIRYVFDCGRSKERCYDASSGVQEFKIDWISKASAAQRRGRAGRTGPGHCYRLYSSAIYEQYFEQHTTPELLRMPIEGTVLQLKNLEVDNVINFPFPTPPDRQQLAKAESLLSHLGAIDTVGKISGIGRELINFPVNPRYGKMLLLGLRNDILQHTVALVAGLAVGDLFIPQPRLQQSTTGHELSDSESDRTPQDELAEQRRQAHGRAHGKLAQWDDRSDAIKILTAIAAHASTSGKTSASFCAEYFLREKGMSEAQQLRRQLHNIATSQANNDGVPFDAALPSPKEKQIALLKQIVAAGFIDHVAIRADMLNLPPSAGRKPRRAIEVAYRTLLPSHIDIDRTASPEEQEEQKNVYIHPNSVMARLSVAEVPQYIVYSDLSRATANAIGGQQKRVRMHPLTTVGPKQLAALAEGTPLLEFGKPMGKIEDRAGGKKRECWVPISVRDPASAKTGAASWPLGSWKVVQRKGSGVDWVVERVISRGAS